MHEMIENQTIFLDGKSFSFKHFLKCNLIFSGYMGFWVSDCIFDDCDFKTSGPAANTLGMMQSLYHDPHFKQIIENTIAVIRNDQPTQSVEIVE